MKSKGLKPTKAELGYLRDLAKTRGLRTDEAIIEYVEDMYPEQMDSLLDLNLTRYNEVCEALKE